MAQTNSEEPVTFLMPSPPFPANTRLVKRTTTKQGATADVATELAWRTVEACLTSKNYSAECKTAFAKLHQAATANVPSDTWVSFRYVPYCSESVACHTDVSKGPRGPVLRVCTARQISSRVSKAGLASA